MDISFVVPVYNEEEMLPLFYKTVREYPPLREYNVVIVFVNDGSTDGTESILRSLAEDDPLVTAISFTRNFGKEAALMAGLHYANGDAVIPMDVDLQDPVEVVPLLLEKWKNGADIVLAKRNDRSEDGFLKRYSAKLFYKCNNYLSNFKIEENVGDFRLIDRKIVSHIKNMTERNLFMKGILSWPGGKTEIVYYKRPQRIIGKSKFNGWKLWNLAMEGFTSFSTGLLHIWTYCGITIAGFAFLYGLFLIYNKIVLGNPIPGYPSLMVSILFLGGVQLIGIGMLGEYISRIYIETKNRPRWIIKEVLNNSSKKEYPQERGD